MNFNEEFIRNTMCPLEIVLFNRLRIKTSINAIHEEKIPFLFIYKVKCLA